MKKRYLALLCLTPSLMAMEKTTLPGTAKYGTLMPRTPIYHRIRHEAGVFAIQVQRSPGGTLHVISVTKK